MTAKAPPAGYQPIVSENPFGKAVGPIFEKIEGEGWVRGFRVEDKHTNRAGIAHGGVLMTFADIVMSQAVYKLSPGMFVTAQMSCQFISPAILDAWVEGRAEVVRRTSDLAFVEGRIVSQGKPVMTASGLFKILKAPRPVSR